MLQLVYCRVQRQRTSGPDPLRGQGCFDILLRWRAGPDDRGYRGDGGTELPAGLGAYQKRRLLRGRLAKELVFVNGAMASILTIPWSGALPEGYSASS
jgi:hypothetical protein